MLPEQPSPSKGSKLGTRFAQLGVQLRAYYERLQGSPIYDERLQEVIERLRRSEAENLKPD